MTDAWHTSGLSVGQVAKRMGIAPSAVRWYADQGLLPCERVHGGHRRFFADVLCRVAMIQAAQQVGLSLAEIKAALAALPARRVPSASDWERLARMLRKEVSARVDALMNLLGELSPNAVSLRGAGLEFQARGDGRPPVWRARAS
jgi:MerR family transcriptional regulator, redox-sensitive transcriptional activator SoxR